MRPTLRLLLGLALVCVFPLAGMAQTTSTEPYSEEEVTGTTPDGEIDTVVEGLTVTFSIAGAGDCTWDFGDGETGDGNPVSHTYAEAGAYGVSAACGSDQFAGQVVVGDLPGTGTEASTYVMWGGGLLILGGIAVMAARRIRS